MQRLTVQLFRHNMSAGVSPDETKGVRVLLVERPTGGVGLIADGPANPGVSATNGFLQYAEKAARLANTTHQKVSWLERDTLGRVDQVLFSKGELGFQPWLSESTPQEQHSKLLPLFGAEAQADLAWVLQYALALPSS